MKLFLCYSSPQEPLAERIAYTLRNDDHEVFFDRSSLPPGEDYDARIRYAIESCDLFVFLISPDSISGGSYALTELEMAKRRWKRPAGRILPVMTVATDIEKLPPFLHAVTVLRPAGDIPAEIALAAQRVHRQIWRYRLRRAALVAAVTLILLVALHLIDQAIDPRPTQRNSAPVRLSGMPTSSGWSVTIDVEEEHVREIFYRFEDQDGYSSTGLSRFRDPQSGLPRPVSHASLGNIQGKRILFVKYVDADGREQGPYRLTFDATEQTVASAKHTLQATRRSWLAFREYPAGNMLVYFTHLLSYKNAFREIRYSIDEQTVSNRLHFTRDDRQASPGISDDDEIYVKIPMSTNYVCVKLIFIDGSEWSPKIFTLAESDFSR